MTCRHWGLCWAAEPQRHGGERRARAPRLGSVLSPGFSSTGMGSHWSSEKVFVSHPWRIRGEHRGHLAWVGETNVCALSPQGSWCGTVVEMCGVCRECTWEMVVRWFCPASISTSSGDGTLVTRTFKRETASCKRTSRLDWSCDLSHLHVKGQINFI